MEWTLEGNPHSHQGRTTIPTAFLTDLFPLSLPILILAYCKLIMRHFHLQESLDVLAGTTNIYKIKNKTTELICK